ncbi:hypothetical protein GII33_00945 [Gordonia pseudamarae]|jgi:hypothetical protein|uniref:Uncharacterized protein n=1 Tax=Gordonia pseudamarae TaxID=2831662 RepID=A0ABX6ICL5_9ACTN|nr:MULTISPECIES: hypothetical protein [Gordonia]MBD0022895.1 hypothetical protein [Gordonia sp. (in: high G+C Gram-positive bacteria)]QHN24755.1 hypothetical protein GII33_00945 [Gordonia pseudamarae]QHN33687.1 hypothetical protein GII31_00940 [Gordonia pseudamarae]
MAGDDEQPLDMRYAFDVSGEVESDPAWWKARAKAAADAAIDINKIADTTDTLFVRNYYGECVEGRTIHKLFRGIVEDWVADLREQATSAENLADACLVAARTLTEADNEAAQNIAPR